MKTPSEVYLKPEDDVGNAVLAISVPQAKDGKRPKHFVLEIYELRDVQQPDGRTLSLPHPPRNWNASRFVERRFLHGHTQIHRSGVYHPIYHVPITNYTVQLALKAWPGQRILSDAAKPFFHNIFLREMIADKNAQRVAEYKENGIVPNAPWFIQHDVHLAERGISLNPYQRCAAYNACMVPAYGLLMDPGTGKTCIMIRKLDYVIDHCPADRESLTLILCPKQIISNWIAEIKHFSNNAHRIHIIQLRGSKPIDRFTTFLQGIHDSGDKHIVLISGYESYVQTPKLHDALEYDLVLLDESQNISNPETKRTKTLLENREKAHNAIIATGTPFRNSPFDIRSQLEFLGIGYSDFESHAAFKAFYGRYEQGFNGKTSLTGFRNIPLLQEKLAKHCFIIRKDEALPHLPQKTYGILNCELSGEQARVYMGIAEELYAKIESYGNKTDSVTIQNLLVQMLRLAEITSGYAKLDSGAINRFDPNPKLELLVSYLTGKSGENGSSEDFPGVLLDENSKAIVWCCFEQNIHIIRARLELERVKCVTYYGDMREDAKEDAKLRFNCDPSTRVLVGTAASGGVGLNLVGFDPRNPNDYKTNCETVIYYSNNWSYDKRTQSMERAHRYITRVPVHICDLLVPGTIDVEIYERLKAKKEVDITIQDIRGILKGILSRANLGVR